MSYSFLRIEDRGTTRIITIDRPESLNALNMKVVEELTTLFSQGREAFEGIRAIILTGSGSKAFVAGADITEIKGLSPEEGMRFARRGHDMMNRIEQFPIPVIAAINGFALGGGCELALACHIRIASDNARLGLPEVNLGLIPGYGGTQRLPRVVGEGNAMHMILTADMVNAEDALRMGLVTRVVDQEELLEEAIKLAGKIATKGPVAIEMAIASVNIAHTAADGFEQEIGRFARLVGTDDALEGTTAFLEKRKPDFKGR